CAFDLLIHPPPPMRRIRPEQAIRLVTEHAGAHFDRRVVKLFSALVGLYPVGSLVRLSSGDIAVVTTVPGDPTKAARPTVKVIESGGRQADHVVELAREGESLEIVEC